MIARSAEACSCVNIGTDKGHDLGPWRDALWIGGAWVGQSQRWAGKRTPLHAAACCWLGMVMGQATLLHRPTLPHSVISSPIWQTDANRPGLGVSCAVLFHAAPCWAVQAVLRCNCDPWRLFPDQPDAGSAVHPVHKGRRGRQGGGGPAAWWGAHPGGHVGGRGRVWGVGEGGKGTTPCDAARCHVARRNMVERGERLQARGENYSDYLG